jgi:hypothetical protein
MDGITSSYSKLRNSDIPLEERIELSRQIFNNSECILPNKNQLLVDWSCQELGTRGKKRDGFKVDEHETELWKILSEVLNDPESEQIVLRQKNLQLLFRELDEVRNFLGKYYSENGGPNKMSQDRLLSVFLCFQAISKNPNMSMTLFNKLENLEQYLKGILTCFLAVLLQTDLHTVKFVEVLFHVVVIVLRQYNTAQHQQFVQRKIFTNLCEKLLPLLLLVRTVVKDEKLFHFQDFNRDEICSVIDAVIITALFHKDLASNYTPTAIPQQQSEPSPKKAKLVNSFYQLFDVLESFAKGCQDGTDVEGIPVRSELVCQAISTSLPFLLENFLKAIQQERKLDQATKFSFFIELYNVTTPKGSEDGLIPDVTGTEILSKMLNVIVYFDVYQIAEDNANDKPIFKWFLSLLENGLLSKSHHTAVWFHCLDIILKLNHKIIENSLETVLAKCFVKSEEESKESDKAKIELLCNIVETYSKLQQLENLVTSLLKVFNKLQNELGTIPSDVLTKLSRSFEHCPFNQTLNILQVFLDEMKEKVQSIEQEDGNTDLSTEGISILFVNFLLNSSYSAADTHGLDQKKATNLEKLVQNIKDTIITPIVKAFPRLRKNAQKTVGFATLFLIHGLNSLILFLHQHNVIPTSDDHYVKLFWDSKEEAYIPDETWSGLPIMKKNQRLRFCMDLLAVHRVRCLLLKQDFDQNEFDHLIYCLYSFQDPQTILELSFVSWNFDPSCVNNVNYPVAHWSLVSQYAALLIPYCNGNQLQKFAEFMVGTLVLQDNKITTDNLVTLHQVSEDILKDGELLSLSSLQAAVVKQFWKLLGECMGQLADDRLTGVFTWEVLGDQDAEMEDGQDGTHETDEANLQSVKIDTNIAISLAQAIARIMNEPQKSARKQSKRKRIGDLSMVVHLVKVLQCLPCYKFTPSNQVRCILGSLACDVLIGKAGLDDKTGPAQPLAAQLSCREIVSTLIQSLLQQREFSAWQVIDMASLLHWLYHTIPKRNSAKPSPSNLQSKFMNASKELLRLAVILGMKSHSKASLATVVDFSQELVTSLIDSAKNTNPEIVRCVEVLVIIVSACTEFLEQKGKKTSSLRAACSIISKTAVSLTSFTKDTLEENAVSHQQEESYVELENNVMRLSAILTYAMGLIPETELSKNEELKNAFAEWNEIVSMLVFKTSKKMEDVMNSVSELDFSNEIATLITVLTDVFMGGQDHCNSIPDELRTQILKKCLEILRKIGFPVEKEENENSTESIEESRKLQKAVIGLVAGLLEEDGGMNCIMVLEGVLEWSVEESDAGEDALVTLLTGLSVFKELVAMKVAKQNKKKLRSITGKIMITLLGRAAINIEILMVVLETVAALVTIGGGVFNPHDLALVFQALALNVEVTNIGFFSRIFMARFAILSWMLFYYPDYVYGTVHVFLPCVRELLNSLFSQGARISNGKTESEEGAILLSCAHKMSRLYQEMTSHKNILSKYSIYFLADCVHVMSTQGIPGMIRDVLVQGVHFLFDICNDDGLTKLHVYLPSNERELFRSLKEDYMKHHKFKGNA